MLGLFKIILQIVASVLKFLSDKKLMDAGKAQAKLEAIEETKGAIKHAEKIRDTRRDDAAVDELLTKPADRNKPK